MRALFLLIFISVSIMAMHDPADLHPEKFLLHSHWDLDAFKAKMAKLRLTLESTETPASNTFDSTNILLGARRKYADQMENNYLNHLCQFELVELNQLAQAQYEFVRETIKAKCANAKLFANDGLIAYLAKARTKRALIKNFCEQMN